MLARIRLWLARRLAPIAEPDVQAVDVEIAEPEIWLYRPDVLGGRNHD